MKLQKFQIMMCILITILFILISCEKPDPAEKFGPLLDKYLQIWNTGNMDQIDEVIHPDFELRMSPKFEAERGIEAFKEALQMWRKAYPDFRVKVIERIYATDAAAVRWVITATNSGEGWHPPTGKRVEVPGMSIFHFQDGKVKDEWIAGNNGNWLTQLGFKLVPPWNDKK